MEWEVVGGGRVEAGGINCDGREGLIAKGRRSWVLTGSGRSSK
jgi:hypothetical protein